jgi:hypothetical protein
LILGDNVILYFLAMEDDRIEKLLLQNNKLIQENNELLKKVYRYIKWKRILGVLYWVLIIGTISGLLFFIKPYLDQVLSTYGAAVDTLRSIGQ